MPKRDDPFASGLKRVANTANYRNGIVSYSTTLNISLRNNMAGQTKQVIWRWRAIAAIFKKDLTGIDPSTGEIAPLFHPRRDRWADHFRFEGPQIRGLTACGRATVQVLGMNDPRRLELRQELLAFGGME